MEADGEVVDDLDRTLAQLPRRLRRAVAVLPAGVDILDERGDRREADIGGADGGVGPALDVPLDVLGDEVVAIVPFDAGAEVEGPGAQIVRGFPALGQHRPGDVVDPGHRHVLDDVAGLVRHLGPGEGGGVVHPLHHHGDPERAAGHRIALDLGKGEIVLGHGRARQSAMA
jgi:hypothetical protein